MIRIIRWNINYATNYYSLSSKASAKAVNYLNYQIRKFIITPKQAWNLCRQGLSARVIKAFAVLESFRLVASETFELGWKAKRNKSVRESIKKAQNSSLVIKFWASTYKNVLWVILGDKKSFSISFDGGKNCLRRMLTEFFLFKISRRKCKKNVFKPWKLRAFHSRFHSLWNEIWKLDTFFWCVEGGKMKSFFFCENSDTICFSIVARFCLRMAYF